MVTDFNPLTQKLTLKPEFLGMTIEISIPKVAYGGAKYNEIRKFDSNLVTEEQYGDYWSFGFYFLFDIVDLV